MSPRRRALLASGLAGLAWRAAAQGQRFPERDVRLIVPTSAGSTTDTLARDLAALLQRMWRSPVVVENVSGASSLLATQRMLNAPADGHTLLVTNTALFTNAAWMPTLPYDTFTDLRPVATLVTLPSYLVVRADLGIATLDDLLAASRTVTQPLSYGSSGQRSGPHVGMALLADIVRATWLHVPYRGAQEAMLELLAGRLDMALLPRGLARTATQGGKARSIAVTEPVPWPEAKGLAVLSQLYPDYRYRGVFGVVAAAGTSAGLVARISDDLRVAVGELDTAGKLDEKGLTASVSTPAEFEVLLAQQVRLWREWRRRLALD